MKKQKSKTNTKIERRIYAVAELRTNKDKDDKAGLTGYAAVFNALSEDLGGFQERIDPGAFKETIKKADVRALWNHDANYVLGRTTNGTLELEEDEKGLKIDISPPDTQWARDLMESINRGDIDQMSFGFRVVSDRWETKNEKNIRILEEVSLFDVSPVTFPAYPDTELQTRSAMETIGLDQSAISQVLVRAEHGLEITEQDRAIIETNINILKNIITSRATPGEEETKKKETLLEESLAEAEARERKIKLSKPKEKSWI